MKILVVMNASDVRLGGGIIQVILNLKSGFKQEGSFQFDYAINVQDNTGIESLLSDEKSHFYQLPNKSENIIRYIYELIKICKKGKYDAIHVHGSSSTMALELFCAYYSRIKKRIAHSHNSQCSHPFLNKMLNPLLRLLKTDALACSNSAGQWLFGDDNFTIIHNAFEINKYAFCESVRRNQRSIYKIDDDMVVLGMVGNLNNQKNPLFSLNLLNMLQKRVKCMLVFIGDGPLKSELEQRVRELELGDYVLFPGVCNDVDAKLQMIDIFLFPSLFEGLGISILEAQISGCCCVASTNVPFETKYSKETKYIDLKNTEEWIKSILDCVSYCNSLNNRSRRSREVIKTITEDYNLKKEVARLERVYRN